MENKNMTALISCFSRAYHSKNYKIKIFDDYLAQKILSDEEYNNISTNMQNGIKFFNPNFNGTKEEALRFIVDTKLSPSVLGRSVYTEKALEQAVNAGTKQYLIFASGYDTYAYRNIYNDLSIFEIDKDEMIIDKIKRLENSDIEHFNVNYLSCDFTEKNFINILNNSKYDSSKLAFCSLLGISYYLSQNEFETMLKNITSILCTGSKIVFDYPTIDETANEQLNQQLAKGSGEEMKSKYSINNIQNILKSCGLSLYENLNHKSMTDKYFSDYNRSNHNNKIIAPGGVNYCQVIKE